MLVPEHFITANIIMLRRRGIPNRLGYIMCLASIVSLPESGKALLIDKTRAIEPKTVLKQWQVNLFLREQKVEKRGQLLAIIKCIDELPEKSTLAQMYEFETQLSIQFPENNHIKDKVRQQLQILCDQNMVEFVGRGIYWRVTISL